MNNLGRTLSLLKEYDEAKLLLGKVKSYASLPWLAHNQSVMESFSNLAKVHIAQGELDEAAALLTTAADTFPSNEWVDEATPALLYLADVYAKMQKFQLAEQRWLQFLEQSWERDQPAGMNVLMRLAELYKEQQMWHKAEETYRKCLERREVLFGLASKPVAETAYELGCLLAKDERLLEAVPFFLTASNAWMKCHGRNYASTLNAQYMLSHLYVRLQRWTDAEDVCQKILLTSLQDLKVLDVMKVKILTNHAIACQNLQKTDNGMRSCARAILFCEETYGVYDHPLSAIPHFYLATFHLNQSHYGRAAEYFAKAKAIKTAHPAETALDLVVTSTSLATAYMCLKRLPEAQECLQYARSEWKASKHDQHSLLQIYLMMGQLKLLLGQADEAKMWFLKADAHYADSGPVDTTIFHCSLQLAMLCREEQNWADSERYYRRAAEGYKQLRGPEHFETLMIFNDLGLLCAERGRMQEAEDYFSQALTGFGKLVRPLTGTGDSSDKAFLYMLGVGVNLGYIQARQGRFAEAEASYYLAMEYWEQVPETHRPVLQELGRLAAQATMPVVSDTYGYQLRKPLGPDSSFEIQ